MKINLWFIAFIMAISLRAAEGFSPVFSVDLHKENHELLHAAKADQAPVIDGKLDDPLWSRCRPAKAFYGMGREEPADEQTVVLAAHDDKNLYLAAVCQDPEMDYLVDAHKKENEDVFRDDSLEFFFGPNAEGVFYQLIVNPNAVIAHWKWRGKAQADWNVKGIQVKTVKGGSGWSVEISIPLAVFALPAREGDEWRFNACRNYYTDQDNYIDKHSSWANFGKGTTSFLRPEKFARLVLDGVPTTTSKPALSPAGNGVECPDISTPPNVDGILDDEAWKKAAKLTNFTDVANSKAAKKPTTVYIARTANALCIGIHCEDPAMEYLVALKDHTNSLWEDDCVEVFLGGFKDRGNYYNLMINSLGRVLTQKQDQGDKTWSPKITVAVKKGRDYWNVELALPFSQIPLDRSDGAWTFNVCRSFYTEADGYVRNKSSWAKLRPTVLSIYNNNPNTPNFYHQPEKFGTLTFKTR